MRRYGRSGAAKTAKRQRYSVLVELGGCRSDESFASGVVIYFEEDAVLTGWRTIERACLPWVGAKADQHDVFNLRYRGSVQAWSRFRNINDTRSCGAVVQNRTGETLSHHIVADSWCIRSHPESLIGRWLDRPHACGWPIQHLSVQCHPESERMFAVIVGL